jgi:hypothetical protein
MNELGDRKPSVFADQILGLAGTRDISFLLREIFLRGLPDKIRAILISSNSNNLRTLAAEADKHFAASGLLIANTSRTEANSQQEQSIQAVKSFQPRHNSQQTSISRQAHPSTFCFYHTEFGIKARKCRQPCAWNTAVSGNQQAGRR